MSDYKIEKTHDGYVVAVDGLEILKTRTRRSAAKVAKAAQRSRPGKLITADVVQRTALDVPAGVCGGGPRSQAQDP